MSVLADGKHGEKVLADGTGTARQQGQSIGLKIPRPILGEYPGSSVIRFSNANRFSKLRENNSWPISLLDSFGDIPSLCGISPHSAPSFLSTTPFLHYSSPWPPKYRSQIIFSQNPWIVPCEKIRRNFSDTLYIRRDRDSAERMPSTWTLRRGRVIASIDREYTLHICINALDDQGTPAYRRSCFTPLYVCI